MLKTVTIVPLEQLLSSEKLDAIIVSTLVNIRYYTGFTGSNGLLLVTLSGATLFTDPRYATQAPQEVNCDVVVVIGPLLKKLAAKLKTLRKPRIGFENSKVSYALYQGLAALGDLMPLGNAVEKPRWTKSAAEIAAIRASVNLNSLALEKAMKRFKTGMKEKDLPPRSTSRCANWARKELRLRPSLRVVPTPPYLMRDRGTNALPKEATC